MADGIAVMADMVQNSHHHPCQLSRIQSVEAAVEERRGSLEDTERLKSIRVMDWVRGDPTHGSSRPSDGAASTSPDSLPEIALSAPLEPPEKR